MGNSNDSCNAYCRRNSNRTIYFVKSYMPVYRITVKNSKLTGGQRVERGMSVDVVSNSFSNPVISDKAAVANAFYRIYGVDIQAIGALSTAYLDCIKIGR